MENFEKLYIAAVEAYKNSYSPYSHFAVGAACLLKNGEIISGCNVENSSYGLSICAERNTLFQVVAKGYKKEDIVEFIVLANTAGPCSPCGACRQVMSELMPPKTLVHLTNLNKVTKTVTVEELLPFAFSENDLNV